MKKLLEVPEIFIDEISINENKIQLLYDSKYNFFWILVNWENREDIKYEILDKYCPDEVELYIRSITKDDEINKKLLNLILNFL